MNRTSNMNFTLKSFKKNLYSQTPYLNLRNPTPTTESRTVSLDMFSFDIIFLNTRQSTWQALVLFLSLKQQ